MSTAVGEKLILCAGPYAYEGFKSLDANPEFKPDYCVVLPPFPRELRDGRWTEMYLFHGIEHFYIWEAEELLPQLYEALAPGGFLAMEQPNLEVVAKVVLGLIPSPTPRPESSGMEAMYGDPKYTNPFMAHKWGWTPATLTEAVVKAGFSREKVKTGIGLTRPWAGERDFRLEATK